MFDCIAIVLVSYNSQSFLDDCLTSLKNQDYRDVQIIIVDNFSPDNSNEFIEKNYPDIVLLKESVNHGFGGACNIGARYALDHGADYVLFLNVDTVADSNLVSELVKYADATTVTTCFTYNDKDNLNPWYSGGRLNRTNLYSEQTLYPYNPLSNPIEVSFISGCCMMVHKEIFNKVGFFDTDYFMYYEDVEYCARMLQRDIKLLYIQSTKLFHYECGSQKKQIQGQRLSIYYFARNRLSLACQHPELIDIPVHSFIKKAVQETGLFYPRFKNRVFYEKKGVVDFFNSVKGPLDFFDVDYSEGFWGVEQADKYEICHCMEEKSYIKLCNYSDSKKIVHLRFTLFPAPTKDSGALDILLNDKYLGLFNLPCCFDDIVEFAEQEVKYLKFKSRIKPISIPNDSRTFTFTIGNVLHNEVTSLEITKPVGFFEEEKNSDIYWNWCVSNKSKVKIHNFTDKTGAYMVQFTLLPAPRKESGNVDIYIDKKIYRRNICLPASIVDDIKIESGKTVNLNFVYKDELVHIEGDSRQFAFQLRNFKCYKIDDSLSKLRNIPFNKNKRFAIYGTGINATRFCEKNGIRHLFCFFDGKKEDGDFFGKPILKLCDEVLIKHNIKQIIIVSSEKYIKEIYERISPICKKNSVHVYDVYDVDLDYKYTIENNQC